VQQMPDRNAYLDGLLGSLDCQGFFFVAV
jgi:hypothetical protein